MLTATMPIESEKPEQEDLNKTILERIAEGDQSAVDDCIEQYGRLVWTLANRFCANGSDAEDASQEIFMELWQKAGKFDPSRGSEANFVSMLSRRRLVDRYRKRASEPETVNVDEIEVRVLLPNDHRLESHEEALKAADCFQNLSLIQQNVLGLSIHDGMTHGGISKRLKIPLGTVKSYARRGLLHLRDCMKRKSALSNAGGA